MMQPFVHIVTTEDMDRSIRAAGLPTLRPGEPVRIEIRYDNDGGPVMVALCEFVVQDAAGTYGEAASIRALRAEPSRFEHEPMCPDCMRAFTRALTYAAMATR